MAEDAGDGGTVACGRSGRSGSALGPCWELEPDFERGAGRTCAVLGCCPWVCGNFEVAMMTRRRTLDRVAFAEEEATLASVDRGDEAV